MGFQQGLSGLNASSKQLEAIGNNVANASTVGFKQSTTQFSDVYAASLSGGGGTQIGIGTKVAAVAQQFSQGNVTTTSNTLDMAINGSGFYRMDNNGVISYSRNGQFQLDKNGFIVNAQGVALTGYAADAAGNIIASSPVPVQIPTTNLSPGATANATLGLNLDSRSAVPVTAAFSPTDSTSFNNSTSVTIFDSLGNSHVATMYFAKQAAVPAAVTAAAPTATAAWNTHLTVDGVEIPAANTPIGQLAFDSNGSEVYPVAVPPLKAGQISVSVPLTNGATTPQAMVLDFASTSQYGAVFGVNQLSQDGYTSGQLSGFSTGSDGVVQGRYSNGQTKNLAQVVLANFSNPQGLQPTGNNLWVETSNSGAPLVGTPGSGSLGVIQSSAVEDSNVDLTAELVNMITAQRIYQANAQTIKTQDSVMQTLVNLR